MEVNQEEIHRLSLSDNVGDRRQAARLLQEEFESLPDKSVAWDDIHHLINDTDSSISEITAHTIGYFFKYVPEESKSIAWDDLVRLLEQAFVDNEFMLSRQAANALCFAFEYVPDENKPQAWFYLTKIPVDGHYLDVKDDVASSLRYLFVHIPNKYKSQAWTDLFRLMSAGNTNVKYCTVSALSFVYSSVPDKSAVLHDFQLLANDEDSYVRMCANHSLGKICIYEASESQNESQFQTLLGNAIKYFEKASNEKENFNPAKFCCPFYLSFEAVVFNSKYSMEEIAKYIANAKREVGQFENRAKLLLILDDLADVLAEIKSSEPLDLEDKKKRLRYCKRFCEHANYLIEELREKVPHASGVLSKGLSIFDRNIRSLIFEIQEKAEEACREARGTPDAEAACKLYRESQKLDESADSETNITIVESMAFIVKAKVHKNPEYHYLLPYFAKLDSELNFNRKLSIIRDILGVVEFGSSSREINGKLEAIYETVQTTALSIEQILSSIKQIEISLKPGIKEEIQVTFGLSGLGSGAQHVITIPLQEIHYAELEDDIRKYADKMLDIGKLPGRLKDRIMEYIRKNKAKLEDISFD